MCVVTKRERSSNMSMRCHGSHCHQGQLTTSGRDELSPLGRRPCDVNVKYLDAKSRDENLSSPVRKHTRSVLPRAGYMQTNRPSQVDTGGTALGAISRMPSRFP